MQSQIKKAKVHCPLCNSKEQRVLYRPWKEIDNPAQLYGAASGVQGTQTLVRCNSCTMIYESPRFPESVILEGYAKSDEASHDSQHGMRVHSFYQALASLKKKIPPPGAKVLDVGTAGGAFLEAAERFGYESYGIEVSKCLVQRAKQRGLRVELGSVDSIPYKNESFDMICMWDVLEHLVDPSNALRNLGRLLKPNGVLLINYPDIGTIPAKIAGKRFWWILSVHLHHFSRRTIAKLCNKTGYEIVAFKPYWQTLQFGYLQQMAIHLKFPLSRLINKLTPRFIQKLPIPYYASQTTAIAKINL